MRYNKWLPLFKPTTANFTGQWQQTTEQVVVISSMFPEQKTTVTEDTHSESKQLFRFRHRSPVTWSQVCIHVYP